jgi:ribulose-phosphate 3-epimerase
MTDRSAFSLAPYITCFDLMHLQQQLETVGAASVGELVFPVGDGEIAPLTVGLELVRRISAGTKIPCHVLLLARNPQRQIEACAAAGAAALTFSLEASTHAHRTLSSIRAAGMGAGIALNPATSLVAVDYLLEKADRVCLFDVDTDGNQKEPVVSPLVERVRMLNENIRYRELRTSIMIAGGIRLSLAARAMEAGVSVLGIDPGMLTQTGEASMPAAIEKYAALLQKELE